MSTSYDAASFIMSAHQQVVFRPPSRDDDEYRYSQSPTDDDDDVVISRPAPAFTSRPPLNFRKQISPVELTPPPSPERRPSPASFNIPPLFSRTGSFFNDRSSMSPEREAVSSSLGQETPETPKRKKPTRGMSNFVDMFYGSSASMSLASLASPTKEYPAKLPESPRRPTHSRKTSKLQTAATLLGFPPKSSFTKPTSQSLAEEADEFLSLDVDFALLPTDELPTTDELFENARDLVVRMQSAYRQRCQALWEATSAKNIEEEELEEARTRASQLRNQLDGMSARVAEQDEAMKSLVDELAVEKYHRQQERESRSRSVRVVEQPDSLYTPSNNDVFYRRGASIYSLGDDPDDANEYSEGSAVESVFSRSASPTNTVSTLPDDTTGFMYSSPNSVEGLREENTALKARIAELEETVEGCLGLMHGLTS